MFGSNVPFSILEGERERERERERGFTPRERGGKERNRERNKKKSVLIRHYISMFCFYICPSSSAT